MAFQTKVEKTVKQQANNFRAVRLGQALFFVQLFFLITNKYFFPQYPLSWEICITYMLIPIGFTLYSMRSQKLIQDITLTRTMASAILGFWLTYAVCLVVFVALFNMEMGTVAYGAMWSTIILMVVFVAPSEELFFRILVPDWFLSFTPRQLTLIMVIFSQFIFGVYHLASYNGNWASIVIAMTIGIIWYYANRLLVEGKPLGIGFSMGSHACYNLVIAGVLVGNFV